MRRALRGAFGEKRRRSRRYGRWRIVVQDHRGRAIAEVVEKKSRFIGHIAHVETEEEALAFLDEVRGEHRMARHNVYAYVLREGGAGSLGRVRYSDDREPAKTAGLPTLEAVQHAG